MAKETEKRDEKNQPKEKGSMPWIHVALVAMGSIAAGLALSLVSADSSMNFLRSASAASQEKPDKSALNLAPSPGGDPWYHQLDPTVANLNEPGSLRYIRLTVTLEMEPVAERQQVIAYIEARRPVINNWLQLYLASRNLEEVKGERNLTTMQSQILEGLNEILFPESKSLIKRVLFGEMNIQ